MNYSVAIRTLGKSPDTLRRELESISRQTILPEKVVIYIAVGYQRPAFNVMNEVYIDTPKGMVAQRAMEYNEIDSELILLLDDDVELADNSAEILISELVSNDADCVAADTFKNHEMSVSSKIKAAVCNLVFPHFNQKWAFKIHSNGSFSYINNPTAVCYPSQSAAGPASLWRKASLLHLDFKSETWLDRLGFAYGDDDLEFYKLYINGGRLFVSFNSGITNLDAKTASSTYQKDERRLYVRAMSNHIRWYRMQFQTRRKGYERISSQCAYWLKQVWTLMLHLCLTVKSLNANPLKYYIKGIKAGIVYVKSQDYSKIPTYRNENTILR